MNNSFSHLIWLGACQAQEPSGLIAQAKQVTLVDARESACKYLKKQFASDRVQVASKLVTVHGGQQSFTEYNLPEYSALQEATGLKKLFPGLKIAHQETMSSVSLEQFFKELNLTDNENALVVDLPDVNQAFLEALYKTNELYKFKKLYVFANADPLYLDAINASTIVSFLQSVGYLLQETSSTDPDFLCLVFGANPLWVELQNANYLNANLLRDTKELQSQQETLLQQLAESKQQIDLVAKEKESLKQQLLESKQQADGIAKERDALKLQTMEIKQQFDELIKEQGKQLDQDQAKQIEKLRADLEQTAKHASTRLEKLTQLEKNNKVLQESNLQLQQRHQVIEQEMIKAEAQIHFIKDFLMKE